MAVFPVVHPKIPKKSAFSPEDSEDSVFYARTESSRIFGAPAGLPNWQGTRRTNL
jgi:hypothetical protein